MKKTQHQPTLENQQLVESVSNLLKEPTTNTKEPTVPSGNPENTHFLEGISKTFSSMKESAVNMIPALGGLPQMPLMEDYLPSTVERIGDSLNYLKGESHGQLSRKALEDADQLVENRKQRLAATPGSEAQQAYSPDITKHINETIKQTEVRQKARKARQKAARNEIRRREQYPEMEALNRGTISNLAYVGGTATGVALTGGTGPAAVAAAGLLGGLRKTAGATILA